MDILGILGLGSLGGGIVASKLIDYFVPFSKTPQGKLCKQQFENQKELQREQMNFQLEVEERRLRCQKEIAEQSAELQKYLHERGIEANKEIAVFQAQAMRQTQMLLAQEQAQNMLQDHLLQDALRTFPLNVSPLVLLKNQSKSTGHLLAFSKKDAETRPSVAQVYAEVEASRLHPDALNIFVAPVYIDSKIKNRKVLSDQIWDTVYQKIETFFTLNYNRDSDHPVIFYPTAWNDKYNPGMHAAETLHFFLKDLPCVVIEPRFDGNTFRMMFSTWGLGYNSTTHHRTELSFPINIDVVLANSAYERSKKALSAIKEIDAIKEISPNLDAQKLGFGPMTAILERNVKLYEALHMDERIKNGRMDEINALDIYNIFKIEPVQDLSMLADYLSARIGINLAVLADIHHLRSYDRHPILPKLLKQNFPNLYGNKDIRQQLFEAYEDSYVWLRKEEIEIEGMREIRNNQITDTKKQLELSNSEESLEELTKTTCDYVRREFGIDTDSISDAVVKSSYLWSSKHVPFFEDLLTYDEIADDNKLRRRIGTKLFDLKQQMKENV